MWAIVVVYLAVRITGALAMSAITALVADVAGQGRRMEAYGRLRVGGNMGWGGWAGFGRVHGLVPPYWTLFTATAILTSLAFGLLARHAREIARPAEVGRLVGRFRDVVSDRRFVAFVGISLLVFVVAGLGMIAALGFSLWDQPRRCC